MTREWRQPNATDVSNHQRAYFRPRIQQTRFSLAYGSEVPSREARLGSLAHPLSRALSLVTLRASLMPPSARSPDTAQRRDGNTAPRPSHRGTHSLGEAERSLCALTPGSCPHPASAGAGVGQLSSTGRHASPVPPPSTLPRPLPRLRRVFTGCSATLAPLAGGAQTSPVPPASARHQRPWRTALSRPCVRSRTG